MFYKTNYTSPFGRIIMAADGENLSGLWFEGQKYFADTIKGEVVEKDDLEIFDRTKSWLDKYFQGQKPEISELSLKPAGNEFRQRVWQILCEIPYGSVMTYGEIAQIIAREQGRQKMSAQAVGGAIGHNPISIIIPCHRVVGSNGNLTGYAGGIETKVKLLKHECVDMSDLFYSPRKTRDKERVLDLLHAPQARTLALRHSVRAVPLSGTSAVRKSAERVF